MLNGALFSKEEKFKSKKKYLKPTNFGAVKKLTIFPTKLLKHYYKYSAYDV